MTRDEAVELSTHYMGGLVECDICHFTPLDSYLQTNPAGGYDDLPFGLWLLEQGWHFDWREHDHVGGPQSGKFQFMYFRPASPDSQSWSYSWVCPACRRAGVP